MTIPFTKMQAQGNDFVMLDAVSHPIELTEAMIKQIADRRRGVGCDQVLVLEPAKQNGVDFHYRIFNADGSEVGQCGNGARCLARFIRDKKLSEKNEVLVSTITTQIRLFTPQDHQVSVAMGVPASLPKEVPYVTESKVLPPTSQVRLKDNVYEVGVVGIGNPHAVFLVEDVGIAPVDSLGGMIQDASCFPEGANVGFLQVLDNKSVKLRVWERGVGETDACGSGACAAVVSGVRRGLLSNRVEVALQGGQVSVSWPGEGCAVFLEGKVVPVFEGAWPNTQHLG